jgi:phospholipid/cholesterol/gamma-HCH transport system ATP-binding protein
MMAAAKIAVDGLTCAYAGQVVLRDIEFRVATGEVFAIVGGSGCGKSTLLKHLIGLMQPAAGTIAYDGQPFSTAAENARRQRQRRFGVLYQAGALWSSLTLAENVAYPLEEYTRLRGAALAALVRYKLALVGLAGFEHYYPDAISGGMRKRAALARAMALDPDILFFDEPSAGLDPVSARRLDRLILTMRDILGATVVVVTHELDSLYAIADRALFLDAEARTATALGPPRELRVNPPNEAVAAFFNRD